MHQDLPPLPADGAATEGLDTKLARLAALLAVSPEAREAVGLLAAIGLMGSPATGASPVQEWTRPNTREHWAQAIGVHRETIRTRINDGTLAAKRFGGLISIPVSELTPAAKEAEKKRQR